MMILNGLIVLIKFIYLLRNSKQRVFPLTRNHIQIYVLQQACTTQDHKYRLPTSCNTSKTKCCKRLQPWTRMVTCACLKSLSTCNRRSVWRSNGISQMMWTHQSPPGIFSMLTSASESVCPHCFLLGTSIFTIWNNLRISWSSWVF